MKKLNGIKVLAVSTSLLISLGAGSAYAQSTEEAVGAIIGGTAGTIIGGELDKKGSKIEGQIIGGLVGGTLGYVIGGELENDNDLRRRYNDRPGEYYAYQGKAYRRYPHDQYGYISYPISSGDPFYYQDGRKKDHPVFAEHPGRGKGKGLYKNKRRK